MLRLISSFFKWQDTHLKSELKYFHYKYFSNYNEKNCQKILFFVFMSKIINSFLYVAAQLIFHDVAHNTETWIGFSCCGSSFHMLWLIDFTRAMAYGKLLIILLIKTGNKFFFAISFITIIIIEILTRIFHSDFRHVHCNFHRSYDSFL